MELQRRYFKGKEVWIEVDHIGNPVIDQGRVKMRYQNDPDAKVYRASISNISNRPADLIDATEAFEKSTPSARSTSSATNKRTKQRSSGTKSTAVPIINAESPDAWGPRREHRTVPDELRSLQPPHNGLIEIHTDGACSGNPGPCGYGVVLRDGDDYLEISQYLGTGTNNIAELTAIRVALESIPSAARHRPVELHTDSTYCIGVLTKGWKAKANRELILGIRELINHFSNLTFIKVKGHAGLPLNERADFMATSSLEHR